MDDKFQKKCQAKRSQAKLGRVKPRKNRSMGSAFMDPGTQRIEKKGSVAEPLRNACGYVPREITTEPEKLSLITRPETLADHSQNYFQLLPDVIMTFRIEGKTLQMDSKGRRRR